jgi:hypothetical protein
MTTELSKIDQELVKNNVTEQVLAELQSLKSLTIKDVNDKEGYKKVYDARIQCKNTRVLAVKICKKGREEAIEEQRRWIAKEKEVVGKIEDVEAFLQAEQDRIDLEKEKIRQEEERKEQARIQARVDALAKFNYAADIYELKIMEEEQFKSLLIHAENEYNKEQERLAEIERQKKEEEERLKRIAAEQEAERKRLDEQAAAIRAEQERIAREQEEREAAIRAEREKIEAEKRAIEEAKRREAEEKKRHEEIEQARKEAAERARIEAESKAKREAEERAEAERKVKAELERQEALRPDKEKLIAFAGTITSLTPPELKSKEANKVMYEASVMIQKVTDFIIEKSKSL